MTWRCRGGARRWCAGGAGSCATTAASASGGPPRIRGTPDHPHIIGSHRGPPGSLMMSVVVLSRLLLDPTATGCSELSAPAALRLALRVFSISDQFGRLVGGTALSWTFSMNLMLCRVVLDGTTMLVDTTACHARITTATRGLWRRRWTRLVASLRCLSRFLALRSTSWSPRGTG